jgi:hypothetical protein
MDGDGLADLVHKSAEDAVFFFANRGHLAWSERREMSVQNSAPPAPFGQPDVRTADMDFGCGPTSSKALMLAVHRHRIHSTLANKPTLPVIVEPSAAFGLIAGVQIADCNGDRVPMWPRSTERHRRCRGLLWPFRAETSP